MATPNVIAGAQVKIYIAGKLFPEAQSIQWEDDFAERAIFGIDTPFAQEIAITQVSVKGSIAGIRVRDVGGLQAADIIGKMFDIIKRPYVSIEIRDRKTDSKILFIPQAKIVNQSNAIQAKSTMKVSFNFTGIYSLTQHDLK